MPAEGVSIYELVAACPKLFESVVETVGERLAENGWET
jgi:hypothetical protein